ncbi:30S ribosomal protein S8 [Candidatus Woesearchaeota archaeon]|nr:30S ribosomal protein S8 [Candidatus Woesearchaeota archaeon]
MLNDTLSNSLSKIMNAEKACKDRCVLMPASNPVKRVLSILKENKYLGDIEEIKDNRGIRLKVSLIGAINKCGTIKPRFPVKKREFERFEKVYLPAKDFGLIIVSTPKGLMPHTEAKKNGLGGKLIAYCY